MGVKEFIDCTNIIIISTILIPIFIKGEEFLLLNFHLWRDRNAPSSRFRL